MDSIFYTPGRRIYRREGGYTVEVDDRKGNATTTTKTPTDTFPHKSVQ